jgi:hypothetical protein
MTIRNDLVIILERFDGAPSREDILKIAEEFKSKFLEFKNAIK